MRDSQRGGVYGAEFVLRNLFERAERSGNPTVEIEGVTMTLPPEARFGSIESIQAYCDRVTDMVGAPPVRVRRRKGAQKAHYESGGVIAVHDDGTRWAMREIVILHELAHHLSRSSRESHGPEFVAAHIDLLSRVMGPEAGLALRILGASTSVRESCRA